MSHREFPAKVKLEAFQRAGCAVDGCLREGRAYAGDLYVCGAHFQRWKRRGVFDLPDHRQSPDGLCTVDGCNAVVRSKNSPFCETHYYRLRRNPAVTLAARRKTCIHCGAPLKGQRQRYCSNLCMWRSPRGKQNVGKCRGCGKPFTTWHKRVYCSEECSKEALLAREHNKRATIRGAKAEKFRRTEIFERDGWRCQICWKKTRRDVGPRHPLAPSLDHIVSLARGGQHTRLNVQCAHLRCNIQKQATGPGQLRLFG